MWPGQDRFARNAVIGCKMDNSILGFDIKRNYKYQRQKPLAFVKKKIKTHREISGT